MVLNGIAMFFLIALIVIAAVTVGDIVAKIKELRPLTRKGRWSRLLRDKDRFFMLMLADLLLILFCCDHIPYFN